MPLIPKKRSEKNPTPPKMSWNEAIQTIEEDRQKTMLALKRHKEANTCSKQEVVVIPVKTPLLALKRIKPTVLDALAATDGGRGGIEGVGEDIGGGRGAGKGEEKGGGEGERAGREPMSTTPGFLGKLIHKAHIAFKRKQDRESKRPAPIPKIDRLWFSIVIKHFPRAVPPLWDAKHRGLAKHLTKRIGPERIVDFVKWAVEHWTLVMQTKFEWVKKFPVPSTPELPFLVKFVHVFNEVREKAQDSPLDPVAMAKGLGLLKGLNLSKKPEECRTLNTPPISPSKPSLPKKDLYDTSIPLPKLPPWRD